MKKYVIIAFVASVILAIAIYAYSETILHNCHIKNAGIHTGIHITTIRPNADAIPLEWSLSDGASSHWDALDDIITNDSNYIMARQDNETDTLGMTDFLDGTNIPEHTDITIDHVTWYFRVRKMSASGGSIYVGCLPHNWTYSSTFSQTELTTTYTVYSLTLSQLGTLMAPLPITISDVDDVELQFKSNMQTRNYIRASRLWMDVYWYYN